MKKYIYTILLSVIISSFPKSVSAQGCVAVKNMGSCTMHWGESHSQRGWQFSLNYRYFRSHKHFRGTHEERERVEKGTEVINNDNSINFAVSYDFSSKWSVSATIPYLFIDRSSLYEHLGNSSQQRFHTSSRGIGDIRVLGYFDALSTYENGTLTLGAGFKLPTGDYNYKDYFHKPEGLVLQPVDQSIQLGDGGFGYIAEADLNHLINGKVYAYVNAMYMISPRNTNGTLRRKDLQNNIPLSNELSVPDQYMIRAGARVVHHSIQAWLGGRMECIPVKDLVGRSDGFRRPGYIISAEPSFFYMKGNHTVGVSLPIALARNRTQSMLDKARTEVTGEYQHGDAAFADWLLSLTYAFRLDG